MAQVQSTGKPAKTLLTEGLTTIKQLPLGYYHDDGVRRYRYAYIRRAVVGAPSLFGTVLKKGTANYNDLLSGHFRSASTGYGGSVGDVKVRLYSAIFLSANLAEQAKYEDGFLDVRSGTGGGGSYQIDHYDAGRTAKTNMLYLKDPIILALGTGTRVAQLRTNPYWGLISGGNIRRSGTSKPMGAALFSATISAGYGFIQTKGPGIGMVRSALVSGRIVGCFSSILTPAWRSAGIVACGLTEIGNLIGRSSGAGQYTSVDWNFE